jgi:dipeptidyl-peptidase-4
MRNKKHIYLIAGILCSAITFASFGASFAQKGSSPERGDSYSSAKKNFTLEQIASNNIPAGVLNNLPFPMKWSDNDNIVFANFSTSMNEFSYYNIKSKKNVPIKDKLYNPTARSRKAEKFIAELQKEKFAEKGLLFHYSPDSSKIAYVSGNNLYVYDVASKKNTQLTFDGSDVILNGYASWVYYEEILGRPSKYCAYWWSPDSKHIAFYHSDDSQVPMFPIYDPSKAKNQIRTTHYPMAGEKNPEVKIGIVKAEGGAITWADFNEKDDQYFGIPFWNADGSRFIVPWMPRVQQDLIFYSVNPLSGAKEPIYKEHQNTWIEWPEQMEFTKEGFYMVRDFSMWEEIYYQSFDGKVSKQITDGKNWSINFVRLDQKNGEFYFTAKREISTRVDFYKVNIKSGKITRLSEGEYDYENISLSPDSKHFIAFRSNCSTPNQLVLMPCDGSGKVTIIADSKGAEFDNYNIALPEMVYIKTHDGYTIPAKVTYPVNFDKSKKYPLLIYIYGGPNTPMVDDVFAGVGRRTQWWAYQDVIQVTMDNRASGHCGKEGLNFLYRNFWSVELSDFEEWMQYFDSKPYVNADKVGINGFSYGGSMTTLCVTEGCKYFKYGIAGGGVYDYLLYDSHYTERYMDTPQRNPEGYARTKMSDRIAKSGYKGDSSNYLMLTHGAADDNVHIQNTIGLVQDLQNMGKQFDLMIYPGQLHGYRGKQATFSAISDYNFWYKHLLDKETPQVLIDALYK